MLSTRAQWWLSIVAVAATLAVIGYWWLSRSDAAAAPAAAFLLHATWGAWIFLPPVWFLYEWSRFPFNAEYKGDPADPKSRSFATLKYSQELASKVWLAGVAILAYLHLVK